MWIRWVGDPTINLCLPKPFGRRHLKVKASYIMNCKSFSKDSNKFISIISQPLDCSQLPTDLIGWLGEAGGIDSEYCPAPPPLPPLLTVE